MTQTSGTQNESIQKYLSTAGRTLTEKQAERLFGVKNLSARVAELRQNGIRVVTEKTRDGRAKYSVASRKSSR